MYEYVDNGNLDQWLHGDVGEVSPLTWEIRMNIILGTAKGYYDCISFTWLFFFLLKKYMHIDVCKCPLSILIHASVLWCFLILQVGLSS